MYAVTHYQLDDNQGFKEYMNKSDGIDYNTQLLRT